MHTPDAESHPLPLTLHEGDQFTLGGDGHNDVAFYNRRESYFRMMYGNSAGVDDNGRINIRYVSRDRRKGRMIYSPRVPPSSSTTNPTTCSVRMCPVSTT